MPTFTLYDGIGGEYTAEINDLPVGHNWNVSRISVSRFNTAAITLSGQPSSGSQPLAKELRLIDLETGRVMAGRTLLPQEVLLPSPGRNALLYLAEYSITSLTVRGYDLSLEATSESLLNPLTPSYTFLLSAADPQRFLQNSFSFFPPSIDHTQAFVTTH